MKTPRMRTIKESHRDILKEDPNSSLTLYAIRQLVKSNKISHICRGNKFLIDYDELIDYLNIRKLYNVSTSKEIINCNSADNHTEIPRKRTSRF